MYRDILIYSLRFVFLVVLQVFIVNQMLQVNLVNPFIYPMFLLLLPVDTAFWLVCLLSFALGFSVDLLQFTSGIHAAACVMMGYVRMLFLKNSLTTENTEKNIIPNIKNKGFAWFGIYAILLLTIHHAMVYFLEVFTFKEFLFTLVKSGLSVAASLALIILLEYLLMPLRKKR